MARKNRTFVLGAFALAGLAILFFPGKATLQEDILHNTILAPQAPAARLGHPKIQSALNVLKSIYEREGQAKAKAYAERHRMELEDGMVQVVVQAADGGVVAGGISQAHAVMGAVTALGGAVQTSYQNLVQALVRLETLPALAESPAVSHIRLPFYAHPLETSEGVAKTGADRWQGIEAYRTGGAGIKICILDLGFKGYSAMLGSELPSSVTTRSFRSDGNIEANQVHGAACAEIVHDMAPEAQLFLVNFNTDVEHRNAVNYIIDQGIDVVSYSIGWFNIGDGKGTGWIDEDVKKAFNAGILWAGSAGNSAEDHWEGTFSDPNSNRFDNFSGSDEILNWYVPAYAITSANMNWDDWGTWSGSNYPGSSQDYDLWFYFWTGSSWTLVDRSENWQVGAAGDYPTEATGSWYSNIGTYWGVAIYKYSASRNCKMELFVNGNSSPVEYNVPDGSLGIPADSPFSITLGATDWSTDAYHSYSSRGPTHDGRIKPDFAAPSGVTTKTYGTRSFFGTSASAPHMAGALGLLLGKAPFAGEKIVNMLEGRAVDLGPSGKDNQFGTGRLNLVR